MNEVTVLAWEVHMVLFMIGVGMGLVVGVPPNNFYSKLSDKLIYGLSIFGATMLIIHLLTLALPLDAVDFERYRLFQLATIWIVVGFGLSVALNWKGPKKISNVLSNQKCQVTEQ